MKIKISLLIIVLALLLTGCWDYRELEFLDFVLGIGVDQDESDFTIVAEIIKVKGLQETKQIPVVLTTKGKTFFSSARSLDIMAGIRLFWAHAGVLIMSEEVARGDILPVIEFPIRNSEFRTSVLVFVARDCKTEDIFKSKPPIANSVSDHIRNIMEIHRRLPTCFVQELWDFRQTVQMVGISGVLPVVTLVGEGTDQIPVIEGSAAFRERKMVGWLDREETRIYSLIRGKIDRGPLVVDWNHQGERGQISYEIRANRIRINTEQADSQLRVSLKLELALELMELDALTPDFKNQAVLASLEQGINSQIANQIRALVKKAQREFESDIFGFGLNLKQRRPEIWRLYEEDWNKEFGELEVAVEVKSRVIATGILSGPLRTRQ